MLIFNVTSFPVRAINYYSSPHHNNNNILTGLLPFPPQDGLDDKTHFAELSETENKPNKIKAEVFCFFIFHREGHYFSNKAVIS